MAESVAFLAAIAATSTSMMRRAASTSNGPGPAVAGCASPITHRISDVSPLPVESQWVFRIDGKSYMARHLRAWRVAAYNARLQSIVDCNQRAAARNRPSLSASAEAKCRAPPLWFLLRAALPWRFSYLIRGRGDPVRLAMRTPDT